MMIAELIKEWEVALDNNSLLHAATTCPRCVEPPIGALVPADCDGRLFRYGLGEEFCERCLELTNGKLETNVILDGRCWSCGRRFGE